MEFAVKRAIAELAERVSILEAEGLMDAQALGGIANRIGADGIGEPHEVCERVCEKIAELERERDLARAAARCADEIEMQARRDGWEKGVRDYAVWSDGEQLVGVMRKPLADVLRRGPTDA